MLPVHNKHIWEKHIFLSDKCLIQSTLQPLEIFDCVCYGLDSAVEKKKKSYIGSSVTCKVQMPSIFQFCCRYLMETVSSASLQDILGCLSSRHTLPYFSHLNICLWIFTVGPASAQYKYSMHNPIRKDA